MPVFGPEHMGNTDFVDLTNITNTGLTTYEIVGGQGHFGGDIGQFATIAVPFPAWPGGTLYNFRGWLNVISGEVKLYPSTSTDKPTAFLLPGEYYLDVTRRRITTSGFGWIIEMIQDGSEVFCDDFSIREIISGGEFVPAAAAYGWIDFDGDTRQFTLPIVDADGTTHDARLTEVIALEDSIEAITHLALTRTDFIIERTDTGAGKPSIQAAQVNIEWKVTYVDDVTGGVETFRIGGADLTLTDVLLPGSNVADLSQTEMAAFVTAFEALALSSAGNAVSIQSVAFLE